MTTSGGTFKNFINKIDIKLTTLESSVCIFVMSYYEYVHTYYIAKKDIIKHNFCIFKRRKIYCMYLGR